MPGARAYLPGRGLLLAAPVLRDPDPLGDRHAVIARLLARVHLGDCVLGGPDGWMTHIPDLMVYDNQDLQGDPLTF